MTGRTSGLQAYPCRLPIQASVSQHWVTVYDWPVHSDKISYDSSAILWSGYENFVIDIARRNGVRSVAELGGGANPILAKANLWDFAPRRAVFDISAEELDKAEGAVEKNVVDLSKPIKERYDYDMVFSKMLCEHIADARSFHLNCLNMLRPGGLSVHFFPTLFSIPFVVNRILPEDLSRSILRRLQPGRLENPKLDKFPALYRWCVGPTKRTLRLYRSVGFEIEQWNAGFGHSYYRRVALLDAAERAKSRILIRHPVPLFTSFALIVLRKPQ